MKTHFLKSIAIVFLSLFPFLSSGQQDTLYRSHYNAMNSFKGNGLIYELKRSGHDTILRYFIGSNQLAMRAGNLDGKPNGVVEKFYPNGNLYEYAIYSEGAPIDTIKRYHRNGNFMGKFIQIPFEEQSNKEYDVSERIITYYDSAGTHTVVNGNGQASFVDPINYNYESGEVVNGLKNGLWTGTSNAFSVAYQDTYLNGKFIEGNSRSDQGQFYYSELETDAEFDGGITAFYEFLKENLRYPRKALRKGIQGEVFIYFIVEKDGSLSNINVVKGIGGGCDEEAIRVMSKSPKWSPGKQRGRVVRQAMLQNLLFKFR